MVLDLALIGAVALGAFAGWRRGFLLPLLAIGGTFIGISQITGGFGDGLPAGTGGLATTALLGGVAGSLVLSVGGRAVSLVHRVPLLMAGDHTLGAPLGAATALVGAYVALAALVTVDGFLAPIHGQPSIDAAAVALLRGSLQTQPELRMIADPAVLDQMVSEIAQTAIPHEELAKYDSTLAFYEDRVRPQMLSSSLGPLLIRAGGVLPVVGRPVDYPTK
jgi:hypothetical protein